MANGCIWDITLYKQKFWHWVDWAKSRKNNKMDKYQVINAIGEGSFGRVYKAKRLLDAEIVAIKVIRKRGRTEAEIKGLRRECEIQRDLHHPNIIEMLDSFETIDEIFVVTEFAHKELHVILGKEGFLTEDRVRVIVWDLVSALYYLHSNHVIHRDLKPQNILMDTNGVAKLCDFGFARNISSGTHVLTSIKGTPLYMAPELIEERPYDQSVDLWSLGCIIYELLVGTPPFSTTSILQLIRLIRFEQIQWPQFVSEECVSFLQGLLQKDPRNRMLWTDILAHAFVRGHILVINGKTKASEFDHFVNASGSCEKDLKNGNNVALKENLPVKPFLMPTDQPIECEEWLAFLHRITKEIMSNDFTSLSQAHVAAVIIQPLRNPVSTCIVFQNIAHLLALPFVMDTIKADNFARITTVYADIKLVAHLMCAVKLLTRVDSSDDVIMSTFNDEQLQCLESILLLTCNLVNRDATFANQFASSVVMLRIAPTLNRLLGLFKTRPRLTIDTLGILIRLLTLSPENYELVERVLNAQHVTFESSASNNLSEQFDFDSALKQESSVLRERVCMLLRLLAKCPFKLRDFVVVRDTLDALTYDSVESVRNIAEEAVGELIDGDRG